MAYKTPTRRKAKKGSTKINLIPILDSVFIFIFFLLMSTQFIKVFEISSDVPLVSSQEPPTKEQKKLNLSIIVTSAGFIVSHQLPHASKRQIAKTAEGEYNLEALHSYLAKLKSNYVNEELVILEPKVDIKYEDIIKIMDAVRMLRNTDGALFKKDKDGIDVQVKTLFSKIIFGNIMS